MKRWIVTIILAIICVLSGCSNSTSPNEQVASSIQESGSVQTEQKEENAESVPVEKTWTADEISALFLKANQDSMHNLTIIDSVVIPDFAYDRVGAVLYVNSENQTSNVAFLDADGHYQTAGVYANLDTDSEFTYCGDGTVTFKIETETGVAHTYQLSISIDGNNVSFVARDDLDNK